MRPEQAIQIPSATGTRRKSAPVAAGVAEEAVSGSAAFFFFCLFVLSYFLHLGNRVDALGAIRIDLLLVMLMTVSLLAAKKPEPVPARRGLPVSAPMETISKLLITIVVFVIVSLPFVRWPGSVVGHGWEPFLKAVLFYVFTIKTVTSTHRVKWLLITFVGVQVFRVLEPLWMHITTGYWGSFTNMGNWELMDRLSGSPYDIINPNGLAFVILTAVAFLHNTLGRGTGKLKLVYFALLAPLLYALSLTGSRSGVLVMAIFALMVIWRSKHRTIALTIVGVAVLGLVATMSDLEKQRYLSIVDKNAKGAATAQGRVDGIWIDFMVGLETPVFGHGLGTSHEANAHAYGEDLPSHTLYTEVLQELGFIGLTIYMMFIVATLKNCFTAIRMSSGEPKGILHRCSLGARDFAILLVIFSVASYGLNEYQWYLLAGLSVVLARLARARVAAGGPPPPLPPPDPDRRPRPARKAPAQGLAVSE